MKEIPTDSNWYVPVILFAVAREVSVFNFQIRVSAAILIKCNTTWIFLWEPVSYKVDEGGKFDATRIDISIEQFF